MTAYEKLLHSKSQLGTFDGFEPIEVPGFLFDFQKELVSWAIRKGRSAIFADCGLGKTPMQLVWADNIVRHTNKNVLILTPLAVSHQTLAESGKFSIAAHRSVKGEIRNGINIVNYEKLHLFNASDFVGCVCDESSILKSFNGSRRREITDFMRKMPFRLLCTATAAPNDYIELGTSSEALGELGYTDMLGRFFKNEQNSSVSAMRSRRFQRYVDEKLKWRFKGHAEIPFWKWVCSWARAIRRPSDLGFKDDKFSLPELIEKEHDIVSETLANGALFHMPAVGLKEQRDERRRTIRERCEAVASLVSNTGKPALVWCHLNDEGDLLENLITDGVQVSGRDSDERKEETFLNFVSGKLRVLITKPKIGAWGLNFQNCSHVTFFPSHSYEQYYQGVRRCWRFGQQNPVTVDVITTEGEQSVLKNLQRKAVAADKMFSQLTSHMLKSISLNGSTNFNETEKIPSWL